MRVIMGNRTSFTHFGKGNRGLLCKLFCKSIISPGLKMCNPPPPATVFRNKNNLGRDVRLHTRQRTVHKINANSTLWP